MSTCEQLRPPRTATGRHISSSRKSIRRKLESKGYDRKRGSGNHSGRPKIGHERYGIQQVCGRDEQCQTLVHNVCLPLMLWVRCCQNRPVSYGKRISRAQTNETIGFRSPFEFRSFASSVLGSWKSQTTRNPSLTGQFRLLCLCPSLRPTERWQSGRMRWS